MKTLVIGATGYIGYQLLTRVIGKPPTTGVSWVRVGSRYSWWNCSKAREQLNLGQRSLEDSIVEAVKWFDDNGYV